MYPEEKKLHEVELKVGLLQKDVELTDRLCSKLSESITKIQELNVNIMQMITLHEQRHEQHEKVESDLKDDIKELHSRITTVNRELHERMDQVEKHITERIDAIRSDLATHKKQDSNSVGEVLKEIDRYKWMILGGALAVGWILGNIDLIALGNLLK
jgi:DNA repair exonuclease SbcCD ATPase subunit